MCGVVCDLVWWRGRSARTQRIAARPASKALYPLLLSSLRTSPHIPLNIPSVAYVSFQCGSARQIILTSYTIAYSRRCQPTITRPTQKYRKDQTYGDFSPAQKRGYFRSSPTFRAHRGPTGRFFQKESQL